MTDPSSDRAAITVAPAGANATDRQRDAPLAVAEVLVLAAILAMALLGNGLVLVVLLRQKRLRNPLHQFMLNLCVADLVVALFQVLPQLVWDAKGRLPGPDVLCRLVKYLQVLGMFASSYTIVAMTMDRHYAICCPLQAHRSGVAQRCSGSIVLSWGLSLVLSLPQVFIFSRSEVAPGVYECWGNFAESWGLKAYVTWMTLAVFILPVLIITVCQVRIFLEIHDNLYLRSERPLAVAPHSAPSPASRGGGGGGGGGGRSFLSLQLSALMLNNPNSSDPRSNPGLRLPSSLHHSSAPRRGGEVTAAMTKTARMTLVIVLVFSVCWAPFFSVQLWAAWDPDPPQNGVVFTLLMLLASLNSCTNPWIYSAFSSSVSLELRLLLLCRRPPRPPRPPRHRGSSPSDSSTTHTCSA